MYHGDCTSTPIGYEARTLALPLVSIIVLPPHCRQAPIVCMYQTPLASRVGIIEQYYYYGGPL